MRAVRRAFPFVVPALLLALAGPAAAAWLRPGTGAGRAAATTLGPPGAASTSVPTSSSLSLTWAAPRTGPAPSGYLVLRDGVQVASGGCADAVTRGSTAVTCTDDGLAAATTYSYVVTPVLGASWVGPATAAFTGTTASFQITGAMPVGGSKKYRFQGRGSSGTNSITIEVCAATVPTCTSTTTGWVETVTVAPAGVGAWQSPPTGTKLDLNPGPYTFTATQLPNSSTLQLTI